jgi:hypothetical protein
VQSSKAEHLAAADLHDLDVHLHGVPRHGLLEEGELARPRSAFTPPWKPREAQAHERPLDRRQGHLALVNTAQPHANAWRSVLEHAPGMFDQSDQLGRQPSRPLGRIPRHQPGEPLRTPTISPAANRLPLEPKATTRGLDAVFEGVFDDREPLLHPESVPWRNQHLVHGAPPFWREVMIEAGGHSHRDFSNSALGFAT